MTPERWTLLKSLFEQATSLTGEAQREYVASVEASDPNLARELMLLLDALTSTGTSTYPFDSNVGSSVLHQHTQALNAGDLIASRYRIENFLGAGGMGEVYRAYDQDSLDRVSIKILRGEYAGRSEYVRQLAKEMRLARKIQNRHVCKVFDVQRSTGSNNGDLVFLVMEFLDGETLERRLRNGPLSTQKAMPLVRQLIEGIEAAHSAGIIHRDLKTSNVILVPDRDGERAVITDFGLAREQARALDNTKSLFGTGAIVGTAPYMAPEQLQGHPPTPSVDIYALGVIMFEVVTGRHPFEGESPLAIALRRMSSTAPSPRIFVKNLDRSWERATLACLEMRPERRPQRPRDVLRILNRARAWHEGISRRLFWTGAAGSAIVGAAAIGLRLPSKRNPAAERHVKVAEEFLRRRSAEDLRNAVTEYEQAIRMDPNYADAWSGLADAWAAIANFSLGNADSAMSNARRAASKAVEIAPNSSRAVGVLGYCVSIDVAEWTKAEPYLKRSIYLDPSRAESRLWYGAFLGKSGRSSEAIKELAAGLETDPTSLAINQQLSTEYLRAGDYQKALSVANELVRLQPFQALGYLARARSYEFLGRYDDGLASVALAAKYMNGPIIDAYRASLLAARGDRAVALQIASRLENEWKQGRFEAALLARIYVRAGDTSRALKVLLEGASKKEPSLLGSIVGPWFQPLREEPRFVDLVKRLGLSPSVLRSYK